MRKQIKMLVAIVCAAAWWSVFYPELCFTEETCRLIQTAEAENAAADTVLEKEAEKDGQNASVTNRETDTAAGIMRAGEDEVVISSRFLEWCEKNLFDRME